MLQIYHFVLLGLLFDADETNSEAINSYVERLLPYDSENFTPDVVKNVLSTSKKGRLNRELKKTASKHSVSMIHGLHEDLDDISHSENYILFKHQTVLIPEADQSNSHSDIEHEPKKGNLVFLIFFLKIYNL